MGWKVTLLKEPYEQKFTLGELLDAIEKNGLPQVTGEYWDRSSYSEESFEVGAACAVGQGALNVGASFTDYEYALNRFRSKRGQALGNAIVNRNDAMHWKYGTITKYYRALYRDQLDETITLMIKYNVEKEN